MNAHDIYLLILYASGIIFVVAMRLIESKFVSVPSILTFASFFTFIVLIEIIENKSDIIFIILFVLVFASGFSFFAILRLIEAKNERKRIASLLTREKLSGAEFYNRYYMNSEISMDYIVKIYNIMSKYFKPNILHVGIDIQYIRPHDKLNDIKTLNYFTLETDVGELIDDTISIIEETAEHKIAEELVNNLNNIETIDDYIKFIHSITNLDLKRFDSYKKI